MRKELSGSQLRGFPYHSLGQSSVFLHNVIIPCDGHEGHEQQHGHEYQQEHSQQEQHLYEQIVSGYCDIAMFCSILLLFNRDTASKSRALVSAEVPTNDKLKRKYSVAMRRFYALAAPLDYLTAALQGLVRLD